MAGRSTGITCIRVFGILHYDPNRPHSAERVFKVGEDFDSRSTA
jgi:hypothetical protein